MNRPSVDFIVAAIVLLVGTALAGFAWGLVLTGVLVLVLGTQNIAAAIRARFDETPPIQGALLWSASLCACLTQALIGLIVWLSLLALALSAGLGDPEAMGSTEARAPLAFGTPERIAALMIALAAVMSYLLAYSLATLGPTTAVEAQAALRRRSIATTWRQMRVALVLGLGAALAGGAVWAGDALRDLGGSMRVDSISSPWQFLWAFPELAAMLAAAAAVLASHGPACQGFFGFLEDARKKRAPTPARSFTVTTTVLLSAGVLVGLIATHGIARIGIDAAKTAVPMIAPMVSLDAALRDWTEEQATAGVPAVNLARELTEHGHYDSARPDEGFAALLAGHAPNLKSLATMACRIAVAAAPMIEAERDAAAAVQRAMTGGEVRRRRMRAQPIRYCLKATCADGAATLTWLISSHASAAEGWTETYTTTMLFNRIFAAGGYCTRTGSLAARFRG